MIRLYTAAYGNSGMNARQVLEEMVCDAMGKMNAFATEETSTVAGEVGQFLRDLRKTALETQTDGQKNSAPEGVKHSRELTTDGRVVAVVDGDILSDINLSQWNDDTKKKVKSAAKEALTKFNDGIVVDGITRKVNRTSRKEFTGSKYSEKIANIMPSLFTDKMRTAGSIDDVVIAATDWARDGKLLHPRTDNFVDFEHGKVLIEAGKNQYSAEVVVGITKDGDSVFYDVVDIQPTQFTTKKVDPSPNVTTNKSPDAAYESSTTGSIANRGENVKQEYSRELDSEYMELAKDPEENSTELRKMVDQAAEQQGYKTLFYHGSKKGGGFTEFRDWQYFTPKKEYAERYAQRGNPDSLYSVFVKMENPFDTRNAKARRIFQEARDELGLGEIQDTGLPDWTDGYDLADYIDENGLNYDAIVLDEGGDLVNGKPVSRGLSYVVRKSNQVKSADAVVYDDNGKVIPLSERFNRDKGDIRYSRELELDSEYMELAKDPEGNRWELQEMVNQAAEAAGYEYKRNTRRKHSPANDVPWQMFVRGVDKYQGNYGDYTYYATDKGATSIDEIMPKLRELAEEFYGETVSDEEINPPDIVMSAGVWDDMDFVQYAWDNYFEGEMDRTGKVPAVVTEDGMIVIDEDFSRVKSGDTVEYDDNGKVIPLSERFNSDKRDIRYSRELETVEALKRQNEILQKQRDYWKEQTRTTDEKTRGADKGEVRSLAGQLIRQYSSKTEVEEILPEMQWLADSIWRNDPKISYTDLQDSAQNIARMVLDGSEVNLNAENWETGQELKRFLRGRYINVDESLKEDIGDFKNFKRSNRSLHFRENGTGTGVASLWLELQNDFGKGLFPDSISNPGDQIRHIADTLTSLTESDMRNPYAADMELTVEQMAADVMARAAGLNRQKATKTDNTADSPLLYSVRMLTWAEVSWSMLPSS